jgi:2-polyprenyl-6-methoxyphenol hydroxylase-like FAD-dependent oxidoreductase
MSKQKVLISGAGVAGPCLAFWLLRYGFEPVLIEHAPTLRGGGYIVDFWGLGLDIAEKMGLLPALERVGYRIEEVRIEDAAGHRSGGFKVRAFRQVLRDRYLSIMRSDLAGLIYRSLEGRVRTLFGDTVTRIEQDDEAVHVRFAHAPSERFDLVVGAGGLHSPVRTLAFGPEERYENYLGYYAAAFSVERYPHRNPSAYVTLAAPGRQISRYSLRGDRTVFFVTFASDKKLPVAHRDVNAQMSLLRTMFGEGQWECPEILKALGTCTDLYFDPVSQIRMDAWSQGRVTLVGDACFCPSLLAGQGSALAMLAGYVLAGELKEAAGDHRVAFRNYELLLRDFIDKKQRAAERFSRSFVPNTKLGIFARNRVTDLMSLPVVARLFLGPLLTDSLALPCYDSL